MTLPLEIGLLRLVAQRIAGPGLATPTEAVRWLTAVQAQDQAGALTSVAMRTAAPALGAVEQALDGGELVKSWPMRGTLHLVVAEDLAWMLDLLARRVIAGAAARRAHLGLTPRMLERAEEVAVRALEGGGRMRREELHRVWDEAGLATAGQRGYHLLWHLAHMGTLCFGPIGDGHHLVVLVKEWIPRPRRLERDEALGEVAERFFRSHGPATVKDLMRWAKLLAADARAGLALARDRLARAEVAGVEYFFDPQTPELLQAHRRQARAVFLLPGFDEFILGYQDRGAVLPAEYADHIVPGGNGMFRPTIVSDGRVVGTWTRVGRGAERAIRATPFTSFPTKVEAAIPRVYATLPD